jgi:hypothetical protein
VLDETGLLYNSEEDLLTKFQMLADGYYSGIEWNKLVIPFSPKNVMKQFNKIFLESL